MRVSDGLAQEAEHGLGQRSESRRMSMDNA